MRMYPPINRRIAPQVICRCLLLFVAFFAAVDAFAGVDMTIFGPKRFDRLQGKPNLYQQSFDRCEPSDRALVRVTNGSGKATSVTSGNVLVNGSVVFGESDFKNQLPLLEREITINRTNQLAVELKSGGPDTPFVIVEVVGRGCDSTPPSIFSPTPADGALLSTATPVISAAYADDAKGSGIDPTTVRLLLDGSDSTSSAKVDATAVTLTPFPLPEGEHTVTVSVADRAANLSTLKWRFTTDTIAPRIAISAPVKGAWLNTPQITVTGTVNEPVASLTINGAAVAVDSNSTFTSTFTLIEGANTLTIKAIDPAGNEGTIAVPVNLDTISPVIAVSSPADGVWLNTPDIAITGRVAEINLSRLSINGVALPTDGGSFTHAVRLSEGVNSFTLRAEDLAGNISEQLVTVQLDTASPVVAIQSPPAGFLTNIPTAIVTGTVSEPHVTVNVNGVAASMEGTGFTATVPLSEGNNTLTATASDRAGNKGTVAVLGVLDTIPPTAPVLTSQKSPTNVAGRALSGIAEANARVKVFAGGALLGTVTADPNGNFTLGNVTLLEGENSFTVTAIDAAGNESAISQPLSVLLDTKPPVVTVTAPVTSAFLNTPQITVTGAVNEPVTSVTVNGQPATMNGLSFTSILTLTEGLNSLTIKALDRAGNEGAALLPVNLDTVAPTVTIAAPQNGLLTRIAQVTVSGSLSEAVTMVTVNGEPVTVNDLTYTSNVTLKENNNTLTVRAVDRAGNSGAAAVTVNLDSTAPAAPVLASRNTPTNASAISISGTAEAGSTVRVSSAGALLGSVSADSQGNFTLANVTLAEGANSFTATAIDAAGNESPASAPLAIVLDTTSPVVTVTAPLAGVVINTPEVTIAGTVNEPLASLTINGAAVALSSTSIWSFASTLSLAAGQNIALIIATDLAGNSATVTLTIVRDSTPPVVTIAMPLPGLLTRNSALQVSGTVDDAEATLTANGAAVTNSNKSFSFSYQLQDGNNNILIAATDKAGNSGNATVNVIFDATPPVVTLSAPATATAGTDVQIDISAVDNRGLTLVDLTADGASLWSSSPGGTANAAQSVTMRLSPALSVGATVTVQGRAVDAAGNSGSATAIINITKAADGPGWLQGKVLDDSRGLTLEGAKVQITDVNGRQQEITTPADGRWFHELPSGAARVEISKSGFTTVCRDVTVRPGQRTTVLDSRLTAIDATPRVIDTTGGTAKVLVGANLVPAQSIDVTVPANALPTSADIRLTPVSNQGLIAPLPAGWSPLAVADLRLLDLATGAAIDPQPLSAPADMTLPLPKGLGDAPQNAILAGYDQTRRAWLSVAEIAIAANATTAATQVAKPGQYALLLADPAPNAPVTPAIGSELTAVPPQPVDFSLFSATGRVVPQASPPKTGLKAAGDLLLTAKADAVTPPALTSGLMVNANISEKFDLKSGDTLQPGSTTQDIVVYRYPCITNIGAGATEPLDPTAGLRTTFPVAPSRDFTIVDLLLGKVNIAITPPETSGGVMVGTDGARLLQPDGTGLIIPAGALTGSVPVTIATLPETSVSTLVGSDFRLLRAIDLTITGQTLKSSATLSIPAPQGFDPALPVIVAKKFDTNGVSRLRLVSLATQSGTLISSTSLPSELNNSTTQLTSSGTYLFLQAAAPIGYLTGQVTDSANAPFSGILTTVQGATMADKTAIDGRYLLALATGDRTVTALDQARGDFAQGTGTITANSKTTLDLKVVMIPPQVVAITPANSAVNVQPTVPVIISFSKPMDKKSINSQTLKLINSSNSEAVPGVLTFSVDSQEVTFYPSDAFKQETQYTVIVAATVKDVQGYPLGQDIVSSFTVRKTTPPAMPPAGSVSATFPDADGFITITATQGTAPTDCTVLLINDTTGEIVSVSPQTNGSFTGRARGQLGDEIKVVIMDYSGNQTLVSYITFKSGDGKYLVTAKGGKVEGDGGSQLDIPEGALVGSTVIKVTPLPEANLPHPVPAEARYLGGVNIDNGGLPFRKEVHLSIPVPADFPIGAVPFLARPGTMLSADGTQEQIYEIVDSTKILNNRITTASPPFDGVMEAGSYVFLYVNSAIIGDVIVSGTAYRDMDGLPGYDKTVDKPVQGAVIRSPQANNFVSYSKADGHYATFGFAVNGSCRNFPITAIHPQTMYRTSVNISTCDVPYIVNNLNFRLADKDTALPDREAPIVVIDANVAPGQPPDVRIMAGTTLVGTEIIFSVTAIDQQMESVTPTFTFSDSLSTETFPVMLRQVGLPVVQSPQTGVKPAIWKYTYVLDLPVAITAAGTSFFKPAKTGLYTFIVEARDTSRNISTRSLQLRAVSADTSLATSKDGPPTVDSLTPADKAKDVMVSMPITAIFSEPVVNVTTDTFRMIDLTASRASGTTTEVVVPATVSTGIVNGRMQAVLTPKGNLNYDRDYKVELTSEIKDYQDKNDSATTADKRFPLEKVETTFSTKKPTSYDLASNLFSGRDIDLYYDRETKKLYSYVTAGDQGWRVVEVSDPTTPQVLWPRPDLGIPSVDFKFPSGFNYRSVAVHPDSNIRQMGMTENIVFPDGNQYGYVRFYSLNDPAKPELVGKEKLAEAYSGIPGRLALYGNHAFIATINAGLQVVNIEQAKAGFSSASDGSSIVGVFDSVGQGLGQPSDILVLNGVNALFTTTSGSLVTLDITIPAIPMFVTSIGQTDGIRFTRIAAAMQYSYGDPNAPPQNMDLVLAASQEGKIRTIDMSNPASPQVLTTVKDENGIDDVSLITMDIVVDKEAGLAFATSLSAVYVIDIKDPFKPQVLNRYTALYDPTGARTATGAPATIDLGQIPAIAERGGWVYAASQQKGVKILNFDPPTIVPDPGRYFILLDKDNKAQKDYTFSYKLNTDPGSEGDFENIRIIVYKDNTEFIKLTDKLPDDSFTLIDAGTAFAIDSSYSVRVLIYDKQTKKDVISQPVPIVVGRFSILDKKEKNNDLVGAVTDGTSRLVLSLKVSPNYQGITPVFSLFDPQLVGDKDSVGKLLLADGREVTSAIVAVDPDSLTAKVKYQAPAKFSRIASDATLTERSVAVDLGIADKIPEIRLKRPPILLVHGLWAEKDDWKDFSKLFNNNKQYNVYPTQYKSNNAGSFTTNVNTIADDISNRIEMMIETGFAASKVNYIGHSMGGLLLKEYCITNGNCTNTINKYVSIDSPHRGSELANVIINVNSTREASCMKALNFVASVGKKRVWEENSQHTKIAGGIIDLAVGSQALQRQQGLIPDFPWMAIVGRADDGSFGHNIGYSILWSVLWDLCKLTPDSSFPTWGGTVSPLFSERNDRIVSGSSQAGAAPTVNFVDHVDHSTVLENGTTVYTAKKFIEE